MLLVIFFRHEYRAVENRQTPSQYTIHSRVSIAFVVYIQNYLFVVPTSVFEDHVKDHLTCDRPSRV